ncbi:potassium transporter 26-like [Macadamia integrifolia]|uniref:potassium transporter 26-like n=1 Tax=Macadamia integrifolia TaxID=60698 RepID=UPI001C4FC34C|nr:potassium transporter 26-like [Macadamia integrifolia]
MEVESIEARKALEIDGSEDMESGGHKDENVERPTYADKKLSLKDIYAPILRKPIELTTKETALLAYQSLGVVYGDIGTSPLYVFSSITLENPGEKDILGILSLIFWTLTLVALVKYVLIVLRADDYGEGGTFALYSLLNRHVNFRNKISIQNTRLQSDQSLKYYNKSDNIQSKTKLFLESSSSSQSILTFVVLVGTCMVIGDGALTPATSVMSALVGIQSRSSKITQSHVVLMGVVILLALFLVQKYGTNKVSSSFSPIMLLWFFSTAAIGIYNIAVYYPSVFKAISPHYAFGFFKRNGETSWELLGAIFLCVTGAEAMFADLAHFSKKSIQLAFSSFVYPALLLTYAGEAAYLIQHPSDMSTAFYSCVPSPVFWPMFVISTLAAIVASQALISASFSIIRQSLALGCFPRVNIVHTSDEHEGQVYSPEVNYILMILCIAIVVGFRDGVQIGNAYGVAVVWVMLITTNLILVVMLVIWNTNPILAACFYFPFLIIEAIYMTSLIKKVPQGGWVPFAIAAFFLIIMTSWTYGRSRKSIYEAENKMSQLELSQMISNTDISRTPGICIFCTDLVNGIPPIISHYVQQTGSLHQIMIVVTLRIIPVRTVLPEERFIVGKLGDLDDVYRCLVQYGYRDIPDMEGNDYVASVMESLKDQAVSSDEIKRLDSAMERGFVFVTGRTILHATDKNNFFSRMTINYVYRFLQKNFRSSISTLKVPTSKTLQVGMLYEI